MSRILTITLNPALDLSTETPEVSAGPKLRCAPPRYDAGGGGVNVSRAIAFLGGDSLCCLAYGGGSGLVLTRLLTKEGIAFEGLGVDHPTRHSLSVTETATGEQFRFVLPGPTWEASDCARVIARVRDLARPGDILVPSGSLPPGVPDDIFSRMNSELADTGVRMVIDTSGPALEAAARAPEPLYVLRMDRGEAVALAGQALPDLRALADFAERLQASGAAELVAIASGAEGTVLATPSGRWHCRPPEVEVVSAVGAGDSFVAGFVLALSEGDAPEQACARGVAAAAAAVMTEDTQLCDGTTAARLQARVGTATI